MKLFKLIVFLLGWISSQASTATLYSDVSCILDHLPLEEVYDAVLYGAMVIRVYLNRHFF